MIPEWSWVASECTDQAGPPGREGEAGLSLTEGPMVLLPLLMPSSRTPVSKHCKHEFFVYLDKP